MNANPLINRRNSQPIDGYEQLVAHVEKLNNYNWVSNSGKLYYIASRTMADGRVEHFVDRHI